MKKDRYYNTREESDCNRIQLLVESKEFDELSELIASGELICEMKIVSVLAFFVRTGKSKNWERILSSDSIDDLELGEILMKTIWIMILNKIHIPESFFAATRRRFSSTNFNENLLDIEEYPEEILKEKIWNCIISKKIIPETCFFRIIEKYGEEQQVCL